MNELKVFSSSEFGELGIMLIEGKEFFPATQCAKILGYTNPQKAVRDHCETDGCTKRSVTDNLGRTQEMKFITEGNLYRLIVSSKLPQAKRFEKFVFDEVLPGIRKNGSYAPNVEELIAKTATAVVSEVMKQIIPLLFQAPQKEEVAYKYEPKPTAIYCQRYKPSVIDQLDDELKEQVHDMMASGEYSSESISHFLFQHEIKISQASICKYKRNHFRIII